MIKVQCKQSLSKPKGLTPNINYVALKPMNDIYKGISSKKGIGVAINPSLCFYNPHEVYHALTANKSVSKWLNYISNEYSPPTDKKTLLIYPCSTCKPYHKSRSYQTLFGTLSKLGEKRKQIHIVTISEPFGVVPEEFYGVKTLWHDWESDWYDCPGLFRWWCDKYHQEYEPKYADKCIDFLAEKVASFLRNADSEKCYSKKIAFVRSYSSQLKKASDHTHRRILEKACEISKTELVILPTLDVVSELVKSRGRFAWDMYGVSHPLAQEYLLSYLRRLSATENE
jgi:archaeosine synthase